MADIFFFRSLFMPPRGCGRVSRDEEQDHDDAPQIPIPEEHKRSLNVRGKRIKNRIRR